MFTTLKTYLVGILAGLAGLLALLLKLSGSRRKRAEKRAELAEAKGEHYRDTAEKKKKTEVVYNSRRAAAKAEIKKGHTSKELENPNDDW